MEFTEHAHLLTGWISKQSWMSSFLQSENVDSNHSGRILEDSNEG